MKNLFISLQTNGVRNLKKLKVKILNQCITKTSHSDLIQEELFTIKEVMYIKSISKLKNLTK